MANLERWEAEERIEITEAGREILHLRCLLRQMVPLLQAPERVPQPERHALIQRVRFALDLASEGDDKQETAQEGL